MEIYKSGLVPGDKVVVVDCAEAELPKYKDKVFTVASNTWIVCGSEVVLLLEKSGGGFATRCLKKVTP